MQTIQAARAEYESDLIGQRVRRGQLQKLQEGGWPGAAPIGLRSERRDGTRRNECILIPDPEQAPLVGQAFELFATGEHSARAALDEMTKRGLRIRDGNPLSPTYFADFLLRNPLYYGVMRWAGVEYQGKHEPIITKELFDQVQQVFAQHNGGGTRKRVHTHYLRGTLACGDCGSRLSTSYQRGNGGRYHYAYCLGKSKRVKTCTEPTYTSVTALEEQISARLAVTHLTEEGRRTVRDALETEIAKRNRDVLKQAKVSQLQVVKLTGERDRLLKAYLHEAIDLETFSRAQEQISADLEAARAQLELAQERVNEAREVVGVALDVLDRYPREYATASDSTKRDYNVALLRAVYVSDRQVAGVEYHPFVETLLAHGSDKTSRVGATGIEPVTSRV